MKIPTNSNVTESMLTNSSNVKSEWELYTDVTTSALLSYLTLCQIILFIFKLKTRQIIVSCERFSDLRLPINLPVLMNVTLILAGSMAVATMILEDMSYFTPHTIGSFSANNVLNVFAIVSLYLVLWFRQTMFYSDPTLEHLSNKATRFYSFFEGLFIVFGSTAVAVIMVQQNYQNNCSISSCIPNWVFVWVIVTQFQIQISVLSLFIQPLIKHRQNLKNSFAAPTTASGQDSVIKLVKRAMIMTAMGIFADVFTIVMYLITSSGALYNVNIVLNMLCIILCFSDWKERLCPCLMRANT